MPVVHVHVGVKYILTHYSVWKPKWSVSDEIETNIRMYTTSMMYEAWSHSSFFEIDHVEKHACECHCNSIRNH